jgi:hypothetical protein
MSQESFISIIQPSRCGAVDAFYPERNAVHKCALLLVPSRLEGIHAKTEPDMEGGIPVFRICRTSHAGVTNVTLHWL